MSEDRFLEQVRRDAAQLRYEPAPDLGDLIWTRIAANVRARVAMAPPTVLQFLASWLRPLTASLSALALAMTIGLSWSQLSTETPSVESLSAANQQTEISVAGDSYSVDE